jgi:hypothetical protein
MYEKNKRIIINVSRVNLESVIHADLIKKEMKIIVMKP